MAQIPRDSRIDSTLAFLSEGYPFISRRCQRYETDVFVTRLMLKKVICAKGEEAARMFYHPDRFTRVQAMPPTVLWLLQDKGSVQQLDGPDHRRRKQMFMALMDSEHLGNIALLTDEVTREWQQHLARWEKSGEKVVLLDAVRRILCRAVCKWAGVPLDDSEAEERTREFGAMIDGAGAVGPRNWHALWLRQRTERWARTLVQGVRTGALEAPQGSALQVIATHRDDDGELLAPEEAVVELLNVLRPTVAISNFIVYAALALHEYPACRENLRPEDETSLERFVQEIRRFYPFFPLIGGRVRQEFDWRDHHFSAGTWVLLDLYGTNHDPRSWGDPDMFRPERFRHWDGSAYNFIPQGGGDHHETHRCPGEWITIEVVKTAVRLLTTAMHYDVPEQNLRVDLSKFPALPESGFIIQNVRRR